MASYKVQDSCEKLLALRVIGKASASMASSSARPAGKLGAVGRVLGASEVTEVIQAASAHRLSG